MWLSLKNWEKVFKNEINLPICWVRKCHEGFSQQNIKVYWFGVQKVKSLLKNWFNTTNSMTSFPVELCLIFLPFSPFFLIFPILVWSSEDYSLQSLPQLICSLASTIGKCFQVIVYLHRRLIFLGYLSSQEKTFIKLPSVLKTFNQRGIGSEHDEILIHNTTFPQISYKFVQVLSSEYLENLSIE